uniref:Uncharacterized protein n=1 Tax=Kalanchoe fedtschenkoi TaxID=63787 RepID=A0A7N0ZTC0_KALFE
MMRLIHMISSQIIVVGLLSVWILEHMKCRLFWLLLGMLLGSLCIYICVYVSGWVLMFSQLTLHFWLAWWCQWYLGPCMCVLV